MDAMQTINGIPLVGGTQIMYWGPRREGAPDVYNGRTGFVSKVYPDMKLVMVHWDEIPNRPVQTSISMVPEENLMSNELVAYDGSRLVVGSRVAFRGREDSDIQRGRCGTVRDIIPELNKVTVHWGDFPDYGCRTNPGAEDLVAEER